MRTKLTKKQKKVQKKALKNAAFLMTILSTDVVAEFGAHYINQGQSQADIYNQLYRPSTTLEGMNFHPTQDTVVRKSNSSFTRILQPFQKMFTPIGTLTFKPVSIPLFKMKIDIAEYPDELEDTWHGFLAGEGIDRKAWPFWKWFIMKHVLPQSERDMEALEVYAGVFADPDPGVAGEPGTSMNGMKKVRNDYVDAGRITPIATGAFAADDDDFCTQIEEFVNDMDKDLRRQPLVIQMGEDFYSKYRRGRRTKYNVNYAQVGDLEAIEDYPNIKVAGRQSFGSDEVLIATPKWNWLNCQKRQKVANAFSLENEDRKVKFYADWWQGTGPIIPEWVATNDLELD
ncbi:MAG: hypothetical protein ACKVPJ_13525 [Chitinophagales bacterium]